MSGRSLHLLLSAALAVVTHGGCADEIALSEVPSLELAELGPASRQQHLELREALSRSEAAGDPAERSRAWGALGQWHHAYSFFDSARLAYENASALAPRDPLWPYHLGRLASREGDERRAETLWRLTLELVPGEVPVLVRLAEAVAAQGRDDEARALFEQALLARPACVRARAGLAEIAMRAGDLEEARGQLERSVTDQPAASRPRYQLAGLYRQLGDEIRAAEQLTRVPRQTNQHVPISFEDPWSREVEALNVSLNALQLRGLNAFNQGRWKDAERSFRLAVDEDPGSLKARQNLALALLRQGNLAAATTELERALEIDPRSTAVLNTLAALLPRQGRAAEAEALLRRALELDPNHRRALHNLGQALLRSERIDDSLPLFQRALELDPTLDATRHALAANLWLLGRQAEALEQLRLAPSDRAHHPALTNLRARFLATATDAALRDPDAALALLDRLPSAAVSASLAESRAIVLAQLGRYSEAATWQRAAVAALERANQSPAAERARRRLGSYLRRQPCRAPWEPSEIHLPTPLQAPDR